MDHHIIITAATATATTGDTLVVITAIMEAMSVEYQITCHTIVDVGLMALTLTEVTATVITGATIVDSLNLNFLHKLLQNLFDRPMLLRSFP